ncbi:MAG TPA: type VI secretion system tip protein TssI/VgrG [Vicinamibacterales bacterium]
MPRAMEITTPLGDDLLFHRMHAEEEMSRLTALRIDLLSPKHDIKPDGILGKNVTVKLGLPDDSTRCFNGVVTRFSQGAQYGRYFRYFAVVRPWLWLLTRTTDCRIFQEMTVPDIVKKVFADEPTADFKFELTGSYRKWVYCVQYRETDFNFVSRLLEEEGITYYIKHTDGHNTVVLTDSTSKHTPTPGYETMSFVSPEQVVRPELERITSWDFTREIQPGVYVHDDYDLERPSVELKTKKVLSRSYSPSDYEVYDYPGHYLQKGDGEQYADVRINEYGSQFETSQALTNAKGICVGSLFTLADCTRDDQNREHLILSATYDVEFSEYEAMPHGGGSSYHCSFVAMSSAQQFRPKRRTPKPFVQGPQTAVVVGPAGDQIYTDKYGRVKVQFHWDRYGKKDQNSSCWIRVSSPWAGKGWGSVATPRIGQEVIVDFLEGDPDQPIIIGRVYNAEQPPPFGFPAGAVISGTKSDTHKGSGYNEMSLDDTAGKERVFVHGQYNMDTVVEHDQTSTIHNNRTDRVDIDDSESIGKNQKWDVGVNRDATIGANETLTVKANRTKSIIGNETITVGGNRDGTVSRSETLTVALQRTHTVGINETISVGAAQEITIGAMQAFTVGADQTTNVGLNQSTGVGKNRSVTVGANQTTNVAKNESTTIGADETHGVTGGRTTSIGKDDALSVAKNLVVTSGDSVSITTGSASITMKKDGTIHIKGKDITIEGSGAINIKASKDIVMKGSKILQN